MTNLTVTPEQLAACERHIDENGQPYYTVKSASDPTGEGFYTVRWNSAYKCPQDNCAAGRRGEPCWHKRTALVAERQYQDLRKAERLAAEHIEATDEYQHEQREQALADAQRNLAQERNATVCTASGEWW